jgi:hypothetical protein
MAVAFAPPAAHSAVEAVLDRDLVYVTGKGGAGKTTVAAALGAAARRRDRRATVCEVTGAHRLAGSIAIDPRAALTEWMRTQPAGSVAAAVLGRSHAFDQFVAAAPGAKELVTVGKCADLARSGGYDVVIVDGPSTGHALGMLSAPHTVAHVASHGPIGSQARALHDYLADPEHAAYVGVALPEDMSLHELLELDERLRDVVGHGLDLVVVNAVYPDRFTGAEAEQLRPLAAQYGDIRAALDEHDRALIHAARVEWLRERVAAPVVTLPFLFTTDIGSREHDWLAEELVP